MTEGMKILIGYDGSTNSDAALDDLKYAGLPDRVDATVLTVADVIVAPPINDPEEMFPPNVPHSVRLAHERAEHKLKEAEVIAVRASKQLKEDFPQWNVHHLAVANSPAWALIQKANEQHIDLVVVGALGHTVLGGRLILGSVSQRVLYEAGTSVRIARQSESKAGTPLKLLVGVDNSSYSDAVIETICQRNWPPDTQVRLLAVVDTVMPVRDAQDPTALKWIEVGDVDNWENVRRIFQPAVDKLCARGLDAAVMIRRGDPKVEINDEAESWKADCIFVGSKGIRGVERLLLGSVASAVSARAHCSVEVVRPKERVQDS